MADLSLTLGRNLSSLTYQSDMTERASRIAPVSAPLGGQATVLGYARWRITSPDSGPKTFVNEDPAGGAGLVGFPDQCKDWYVLLERTGESFRIVATDPDAQEITLATWSASLLEGELFQLRMTAPGTVFTAYSYRQSVAGVLPPPPGIPIMDAEVTALAGSVITVRDGWLNGGPAPVASDGQHVGRSARLSTLVATDVITGFAVDLSSGIARYVYSFADVSDYQVGDWMRRAANNGATWYGDINTLITPAFPAAMTIVDVDTGANTVTVVSRDGGTSLNRTIYDNAGFGAGYTDIRIYRPVATLATVTASSGSAHTLTLNAATDFSVSGGPGAVELLIANTTTSGKVPWYLEHPVYVQESPTGIGVKLRTIDRSQNPPWLGVQNLVPNGVMRTWTTATSLADGWLGAASLGAIGSATPANFRIAQNTDPLYTRVGGKSQFFSTTNGVLYAPPIAWTPQYVGQRFSVRVSLILTQWDGNAAIITLQLGIMQADGTVLPWYEQPRSVLIQPATTTAPRPDPPFRKFAAGVWGDLALNDFDITEPSAYPFNPRPTAGDIANLSAAQGLVAILTFNGGGSTIEGYLDGIAVTTSHEAPADVKEFYDANRLHQDTNVQLAEFGPPQFTVAVDFFDAKRMNPALDEPDAAKGVVALITEFSLGISNIRRRITDVWRNIIVPGETRITIGKKKRRLTDAVAKPPATKPPPVTGGSGGGGGTGGGTPPGGGSSAPTIALAITLDEANLPTATATGSVGVTRAKIAWRTDRYPTVDEVRAAPSTSTIPFTSIAPFTLAAGETAYASALGYDAANVETGKADATSVAPAITFTTPWYFGRSGVGQFQDDALSFATGNGEAIAAWVDSLGSGRKAVHTVAMNPVDRPVLDGGAVHLGQRLAGPGASYLEFPGLTGLTDATILYAIQADEDPQITGGGWLDNFSNDTKYSASDGHIRGGFGLVGTSADLGDPATTLTTRRVFVQQASATQGYRALLDGVVLGTRATGTFTFGWTVAPNVGQVSGGGHWLGKIWHVVILPAFASRAEIAAWMPFLSGATATPPIEASVAAPSLTYERVGGDVVVTLTAAGADSAKFAADLAGVPSDATVRAAGATTTLPLQATFAAPGTGETLHVKAFGYHGLTESDPATLDIVGSAGSGSTGSDGGATGSDEGPAPTNAEYVLAAVDGALPNSRVLTDTDSIAWDFTTDGEAKATVVGGYPPTRIASDESFRVPADRQVLIAAAIDIEGELVVEGSLIMVD